MLHTRVLRTHVSGGGGMLFTELAVVWHAQPLKAASRLLV